MKFIPVLCGGLKPKGILDLERAGRGRGGARIDFEIIGLAGMDTVILRARETDHTVLTPALPLLEDRKGARTPMKET